MLVCAYVSSLVFIRCSKRASFIPFLFRGPVLMKRNIHRFESIIWRWHDVIFIAGIDVCAPLRALPRTRT